MIWKKLASACGFSTTETATILSALSILAATASPVAMDYLEQARCTRATIEVRVIGTGLVRMLSDIGERAIYRDPSKRSPEGLVELLVSDGEAPGLGPNGDPRWLASPDGTKVALLEDYLVYNTVGYKTELEGDGAGSRREFAWRGPYIQPPISPDPWGNRYAINVRFLLRSARGSVVVVSAGRDELVDTAYESPLIRPGGDDIVFLVSSPY